MIGVRIQRGSTLLHYRLIERLGEGGMAVVWKALDTTLDREVAIKFLPEAFAAEPERLARFEREAKLLASLSHPNVAAVYGLHEVDGVHFLAMELVRGRTLTEEIHHGLTPERAAGLGAAIADGLAAAHRQHVIHRDLKPDNIMIDAEGRPKILDFGLAKTEAIPMAEDAPTAVQQERATREGTLVGTIAYMSPEQAQGKAVDARSDIFSFGIVLYEMVTGRRPFTGDNSVSILSSILRDTPPPVTRVTPSAPRPLDHIIGRCLEKDPGQRYADASGLRDDLRVLSTDLASDPGRRLVGMPRSRAPLFVATALVAVAVGLLGTWLYQRTSRQRWVRNEGLPQLEATIDKIQGLEEGRESWDAWVLAQKIRALAPKDPLLARLVPKFTRPISITSEPPGADVYATYYDEPDAKPVYIGKTPLLKVRYPRGFTRLRLQLDGKPPIDDVIWNFPIAGSKFDYRFHAPGEVPDDMAWIPPGAFDLVMPGLDHLKAEPTAAFLMDRHEVTNRDYKRFVDAGGYTNEKFWLQPFVENGRTLSFKEAIARFTDRTGRPGPGTWEVGSYPEGQDDYPVSGLSWYEAAAYANFAGKSLPTIFHWDRVAFTVASSRIIPMSNLSHGKAPVSVNSTRSLNRFGVKDLCGNVREWTWNAAGSGGARYILGGGWNDPDYSFGDAYAQPPFDRSPTNGFRCIRYIEKEPNLVALQRTIEQPSRDFLAEKPISDETFQQYLRLFAYDRKPLAAKIEEVKQTAAYVRQKITFDAGYGAERMMAYLFLPPSGKPPYQVVVVFPGSGAISARSSAAMGLDRVDFLVRSGRAVMFPIYKGTFERGEPDLHSDYPDETTTYKDYVTMWGKDIGRSIDYLETRKDIDSSRIAYYGLSWGAAMGAIMPAVERRIKVNVLYVAGLYMQRALPEADQVTYVRRVMQPSLILNGENDFYFPSETSQRPMFELLGTPAADKKRLVFKGGHSVPRTEMIRESLQWLDHYLGPVDQQNQKPEIKN